MKGTVIQKGGQNALERGGERVSMSKTVHVAKKEGEQRHDSITK